MRTFIEKNWTILFNPEELIERMARIAPENSLLEVFPGILLSRLYPFNYPFLASESAYFKVVFRKQNDFSDVTAALQVSKTASEVTKSLFLPVNWQ